jgi:hypothetical protein
MRSAVERVRTASTAVTTGAQTAGRAARERLVAALAPEDPLEEAASRIAHLDLSTSQAASSSASATSPPRQQALEVQLPPDVGPGQHIFIQTPDGRTVEMEVPPGCAPGSRIRVRVSAVAAEKSGLQQKGKTSLAARRLIKAQGEALPGILAKVRDAGHHYNKHGHYAWWVWPTTKPGNNDPKATAVENTVDVAAVLAGPALGAWTELLERFANTLRARESRRVFPSIDHRRIDYFCHEWSSQEYKAVMEGAQPEFAAAAARFVSAWQHVGAAPPPLLAPKAVART